MEKNYNGGTINTVTITTRGLHIYGCLVYVRSLLHVILLVCTCGSVQDYDESDI